MTKKIFNKIIDLYDDIHIISQDGMLIIHEHKDDKETIKKIRSYNKMIIRDIEKINNLVGQLEEQ